MNTIPRLDWLRGKEKLDDVRECAKAYLSALENEERVTAKVRGRPENRETVNLMRSATLSCLRALALESKAAEEDPNVKKMEDP